MKILYVSSEIVPYAKTGGLADVAGSLPKHLKKLRHEIILAMPLYGCIDKKKYKLKNIVKKMEINIGTRKAFAEVYYALLPKSNVPVYFISNEYFFNRKGLYQHNGFDYDDNPERFAFFNIAVLKMLKKIKFQPDIIHTNDWQTAYIPIYLNSIFKSDKFYKDSATLYTIHNLRYQGVFHKENIKNIGLDWNMFKYDKLEYWDMLNISKGGIVYADLISTVSPRYSKEIQTYQYGCGLDSLLRQRKNYIYGILNGVDYNAWDPSKDKNIVKRYSINNLKDKEANKKALLEKYGLKYKKEIPLIGIISRLDKQKGFDILCDVIGSILNMDVYFILLGTGSYEYENIFTKIKNRYSGKVGLALRYDAELAQWIYAGSDMFLMPSHYEPCGLSQLISLKYGTIPIVRGTGGLADTIIDVKEDNINGNGFVFYEYSGAKLLSCVDKAVKYYKHRKAWNDLMVRAMNADYSWDKSTLEYVKLYEKVLAKKKAIRKS